MRLDYWTPWLTLANGGREFALAGAESQWGTPLGALVYQYSGFYPILTAFDNYGPESYYDLVQDRSGTPRWRRA